MHHPELADHIASGDYEAAAKYMVNHSLKRMSHAAASKQADLATVMALICVCKEMATMNSRLEQIVERVAYIEQIAEHTAHLEQIAEALAGPPP